MGKGFNCIRCGECCKNLSIPQSNGLSLFPWEKRLFPQEKVKLHLGYGTSPDSSDFRVFLYKYIGHSCEKLEGERCTIYQSRPLVCRSYPFRYVLAGKNKASYEAAPECPGVQTTKEESQNRKHFPEIYAAEEIGMHLTHFYTMKASKWEFDDLLGRWLPLKIDM
jgi:Fe-S-cluster containining protein